MKLVRPLLITLGVILAFGAVVVGLALTPGVQRWAILRAASKQPDLRLSVASVSAGFRSVSARDVLLEQRGVQIKLTELDADYSLWALLFGREIKISRLRTHGLMVDASRVSPTKAKAGAAAAPAAAPAALARLELPYALTLGDIEIEGQALLAGAPGKPAMPAEFKITGGDIAPSKEGTLRLKAKLSDPAPGASVTGLQVNLSLQLKQSLRRTFDRAVLVGLVDADGPQFAGPNQLKVSATLARTSGGEEYTVSVDTARDGKLENVLAANARLPLGDKTFAGEWTLSARNTQLEPFLLGGALPKFDARGSGRFTYATPKSALTLQGSLQVEASNLEALKPQLRAIGAVKLRSEFDLAKENGVARLNKLVVALSGEQPVLELTASGAADFNLRERRLLVGGSAPGEVARLKLQGVPMAWVRPFVSGVDVSGGAITGEIVCENAGGQKLVARNVAPFKADGITVVQAGRTLVAKAAVEIEAETEFAADKMQARIKNFSVRSPTGDSIRWQATISAPVAEHPPLTIELNGSADFPKLLAPLLPIGRIQANGALDATWYGNRIEVRQLKIDATDEAKRTLASVAAIRPVAFDLVNMKLEGAAGGEVELVRLTLGRLPLATFSRFVPDLNFSGSLAQGDFTLAATGEKLVLRSNAPLTLTEFHFGQPGRPLLANTRVQASPRIELTHGPLPSTFNVAATGDVAVFESTGASMGKLAVQLTQDAGGTNGAATFNIDFPGLANQPVWAKAEPLSAGRASGEVRFASGASALQFEARATLNGLVTRDTNQTLPVANLSLRVVAQPDGRVSVQAPVLIDQAGNRSDLNLAAEGARRPDGALEFSGSVTGEHVELADAQLLASIFGAPLSVDDPESAAAQNRALSPPSADAKPFWAGIEGKFVVDVKSVTKGKDWTMSGVAGQLTVTPLRIEVAKLAANFSEKSKFAAQGAVDFVQGPEPYHLVGNFSLTEFDLGKYFKADDASRPPAMEGIFNIQGQFEGRGLTFEDTLDRARGKFELNSRQGVYRGFRRLSDKVSLATKAVGLVGAWLGDKSADKIASATYYGDQIAQILGEVPFDKLNVKLVRDETLNLQIQDIDLVAQEVHLTGKGKVTYEAGKPLLEQPLTAVLTLGARGKLEENLLKLKKIDTVKDELGYSVCKEPVNLSGTLMVPNPMPFFAKLVIEKLNDMFTPEKPEKSEN